MDVEFADEKLQRLEAEAAFAAGLSQALVKAFRRRMQQIRAAVDERDFYALKSLRFEKLSGARRHQHSMRLNDQYRLVVELVGQSSRKTVRIIGIEDYH
jgi:proteic killer suppression protein